MPSHAPTDVFPWQTKRHAFIVHSSKSDVNVRMLGVVMDGCDPFELCAQVKCHPFHQLTSVLLEIQAVSKLNRYDDFKEPLVAGALPFVEL
jgi:PleD family two-component response regulator